MVFLQDMKSNVFALDLATGRLRWRHLFGDTNPGPDGVAVADGRIYGATDTTAFALDAHNGRLLWRRLLVTPSERYVDVAPQVDGGSVYLSTIGLPPNGRGALYALSRHDGRGALAALDDQEAVAASRARPAAAARGTRRASTATPSTGAPRIRTRTEAVARTRTEAPSPTRSTPTPCSR